MIFPPRRPSPSRQRRGAHAYRAGQEGERRAMDYMKQEGYQILAHRLRTPMGEIDLIAASDDWILAIEVKHRSHTDAGRYALSSRQSERLLAAFAYVLDTHPEWQRPNTRIDVILTDAQGACTPIQDALRLY